MTERNLNDFIDLQYETDKQNGETFAEGKVDLNRQQFEDEKFIKVLAYYGGAPAGTMNVIVSDKFVEIDDLAVQEVFRRKGIGSQLQQFVMDRFPDHTVILVADGEDTPKEMYQRQRYKCAGFKYEVQRID